MSPKRIRDDVVTDDARENQDEQDGDLEPGHPKRTRRGPRGDPPGLRLRPLDEFRRVRMPRVNLVQMAEQVLGPHRHIADRTPIHLRQVDPFPRLEIKVRRRSYLGVPRTTTGLTRTSRRRSRRS